MNSGKTLFAQLMDFLPWSTFTRIVARYRGGSAGADAVLRRALSGHGIRAVDLPGKSTRHRNLLVGADLETLFHGLPRSGAALDAGRCQRGARLAHLRGVGPAIDRKRCAVSTVGGLDRSRRARRATKIASYSANGPASSRTGPPTCKLRPSCRMPRASRPPRSAPRPLRAEPDAADRPVQSCVSMIALPQP